MNDLEICKRIAEIEGLSFSEGLDSIFIKGILGEITPKNHWSYTYSNYNPLKDDALCFQLMIKYNIERRYEPYDCLGWNYHSTDAKSLVVRMEIECDKLRMTEISPNKAICLAIIESRADDHTSL